MGSAPSVYSMMFKPCGAEHLSLCIQSFSFWSLSFRALSLFLGREMNSKTCMLKSEVPLCVIAAKCCPIVWPCNLCMWVLMLAWGCVPGFVRALWVLRLAWGCVPGFVRAFLCWHRALGNTQEWFFLFVQHIVCGMYDRLCHILNSSFCLWSFSYMYMSYLLWCRSFSHSYPGLDSICTF